jgi:hypothetical protein
MHQPRGQSGFSRGRSDNPRDLLVGRGEAGCSLNIRRDRYRTSAAGTFSPSQPIGLISPKPCRPPSRSSDSLTKAGCWRSVVSDSPGLSSGWSALRLRGLVGSNTVRSVLGQKGGTGPNLAGVRLQEQRHTANPLTPFWTGGRPQWALGGPRPRPGRRLAGAAAVRLRRRQGARCSLGSGLQVAQEVRFGLGLGPPGCAGGLLDLRPDGPGHLQKYKPREGFAKRSGAKPLLGIPCLFPCLFLCFLEKSNIWTLASPTFRLLELFRSLKVGLLTCEGVHHAKHCWD